MKVLWELFRQVLATEMTFFEGNIQIFPIFSVIYLFIINEF